MGKPKIKRKSTLIDMTAMSDVTVLLLTFFMLTSTFLSKEPTIVETPSSVSQEKVPMENLVTVLVSGAQDKGAEQPVDRTPEGKVFIGFTGSMDSVYSSEKIRYDILNKALEIYNDQHKEHVDLTAAQKAAFTKIGSFGVPMKDLPAFLDMPTNLQDAMYKYDAQKPEEYAKVGIPIDDNRDENHWNEFQIWMRAALIVSQDYKNTGIISWDENNNETRVPSDALYEVIKRSGKGITVKGDKDTPYSVLHTVLDNLQTVKLNKFTIQTALKTEAD